MNKVFYINHTVINVEPESKQCKKYIADGEYEILPSLFGELSNFASNKNTTVTGWVDEVLPVAEVVEVARVLAVAPVEAVEQVGKEGDVDYVAPVEAVAEVKYVEYVAPVAKVDAVAFNGGTWSFDDTGILAGIEAQKNTPSALKLKGVEFNGVMCSAVKMDMFGLNSIKDYVLAGNTVNFEFENGNKLVLTPENFGDFEMIWTPFRASFF